MLGVVRRRAVPNEDQPGARARSAASRSPPVAAGGRLRPARLRALARPAAVVHRLVGEPVGVRLRSRGIHSKRHVGERRPQRGRLARKRAQSRVLDLPAARHLLDDELGVHPDGDRRRRRARPRPAARRAGRDTRRRCWCRRRCASLALGEHRTGVGVAHDRAVAGRPGIAARSAVRLDDDALPRSQSPDSAVRTRMRRQFSQRTTSSGAAVANGWRARCRTARSGSPRTGAGAAGRRRPRRSRPGRGRRAGRRSAGSSAGDRLRGRPHVGATRSSISANAASRAGFELRSFGVERRLRRSDATAARDSALSRRSITSSRSSSRIDWRRASVAISCCRLSELLRPAVPPACSRCSSRAARARTVSTSALQPALLARSMSASRSRASTTLASQRSARLRRVGERGELGQRAAAVRELGQRGVGRLQVEQPQLGGGVGVHSQVGSIPGRRGMQRPRIGDRRGDRHVKTLVRESAAQTGRRRRRATAPRSPSARRRPAPSRRRRARSPPRRPGDASGRR